MAEFIVKEFKSILNKRKYIDSWFWDRYSINPYNGCQFGRVYCDSRSAKYHLPTDFENAIVVKKNVGEMLSKRITRARTLLPDVTAIGGTTDAYQPAEAKYFNTRDCLKVLLQHGYPVHIVTKSRLALRDLELLDKTGEKTWATVSVTITTSDEKIARFLEKKAPSPDRRFEIIERIKSEAQHVQTGALLMPVIPGLTDSPESIEEIVKRSADSGADYILFGGGLTMRDIQAKWFLERVKKAYPEIIDAFEEIYNFEYNPVFYNGNYTPDNKYSIEITKLFFSYCEKYKIPYRIKRFIPDDHRKLNYILSAKFLAKAYHLQVTGKYYKNYYWAGQNIQNLSESIKDIAKRGELKTIENIGAEFEKTIFEFLEKY